MVPRDQTQVISLDSSHFSSLSHFTSPLSFINHCFCDSAWMCHLLLGEVLTNTHSYFCPLLTRYNLHPFSPLTLQDIPLTSVLFKNQHYPEFDGANDMFVPVLNVLLILAFLLEAWSKKTSHISTRYNILFAPACLSHDHQTFMRSVFAWLYP